MLLEELVLGAEVVLGASEEVEGAALELEVEGATDVVGAAEEVESEVVAAALVVSAAEVSFVLEVGAADVVGSAEDAGTPLVVSAAAVLVVAAAAATATLVDMIVNPEVWGVECCAYSRPHGWRRSRGNADHASGNPIGQTCRTTGRLLNFKRIHGPVKQMVFGSKKKRVTGDLK